MNLKSSIYPKINSYFKSVNKIERYPGDKTYVAFGE